MLKSEVLAEAFELQLLEFVTQELDGHVDFRTGEILSERQYEALAWKPSYEALPAPFFGIRSHLQMKRYLDSLDRRSLVLRNDCRALFDQDKGDVYLSRRPVRISAVTLRKLTRLVDLLDYRNVILKTPEQLATRLRVQPKNLYRYLHGLSPLIRVIGPRQGLAKGSLMIQVNPAYGFRYEAHSFCMARQDAFGSWFRAVMQ